MTGLFTGGDIDVDDDNVGNEEIPKTSKKPISPTPIPKRPPLKRPPNNNKEDPWFSNNDKTISKPDSSKPTPPEEDVWFSGESKGKPVGGGEIKPKPAITQKRPVKMNENYRGKNNNKPGGSMPRNINLSDDDGGGNGNGNKIKKKIVRPMRKAETDENGSTDDDFWFSNEKNKKVGTVTRN